MEWLTNGLNPTEFIKKYKYIVFVLLLGICLMLIPGKNEDITVTNESVVPKENELQTDLENILSKIDGAGRVQVLLTQAAGEEIVYQSDEDISKNSDTTNNTTKTVIISDASRTENGLISKIISPIYKGAIVVCQGGNNPVVRLAIVEAVSKVTGLSSNQISVLKMK